MNSTYTAMVKLVKIFLDSVAKKSSYFQTSLIKLNSTFFLQKLSMGAILNGPVGVLAQQNAVVVYGDEKGLAPIQNLKEMEPKIVQGSVMQRK